MAILIEADEARDLSRVEAPTGMALTVDEGLSFLNALTDGMDRGETFAVASDSESSIEVNQGKLQREARGPIAAPAHLHCDRWHALLPLLPEGVHQD